MSVVLLLIPLSVLFAAGFLAAYIWAVRSGQYEDTCTPSMRMLLDDRPPTKRGRDQCAAKEEPRPARAERDDEGGSAQNVSRE